MILIDLLLIIGFFYSTAGAFVATVFFLRNRWRIDDRGILWCATVVTYFIWPMFVLDGEARRAAFHKEA